MRQISVCQPSIGKEELSNVVDCLKSNWISSKGKYIPEFEGKFAKFCDRKYAVATTSGTTALHLALVSLGVSRGDEVIVPTFTMVATVFAILYTQAKPVFVDIEPDTFNIDPAKIEVRITKKTKAIIAVHLYGHPCQMDLISDIAKKHKLFLIEDAAEAHGAEFRGRKVGSLSDVAAFSFYANKIITTGEGGMLITNNTKLARKAAILRDVAYDPQRRFHHLDIGFNYRMTNIQAAIGLAQLKKINDFINRRRHNAFLYNQLLKDVGGITLPVERPYVKNIYWMYGILINKQFGITKDRLRQRLKEKGIETRDFFIPMHQQPFIKRVEAVYRRTKFPVAEEVSKKGFYLPSSSGLKPEEIRYITKQIKEISRTF